MLLIEKNDDKLVHFKDMWKSCVILRQLNTDADIINVLSKVNNA